jgi:hypothetical protein
MDPVHQDDLHLPLVFNDAGTRRRMMTPTPTTGTRTTHGAPMLVARPSPETGMMWLAVALLVKVR